MRDWAKQGLALNEAAVTRIWLTYGMNEDFVKNEYQAELNRMGGKENGDS